MSNGCTRGNKKMKKIIIYTVSSASHNKKMLTQRVTST